MDTPSNIYLHGLNLLPEFGPKRLLKLSNYFENFMAAFTAPLPELLQAGIELPVAEKFIIFRNSINLEAETARLARENIQILGFMDTAYPKLLMEISSLPPILYYKGRMDSPEELAMAVVGTRKITTYGKSVIPYLIEPLIEAGITIVSGLAYGVDGAAHKLAVSKGGRTVALLGCGIDSKSIYPKDHSLLAEEIIQSGGAILSEYPPGTPAFKQHFVARNRIISGMSMGTILIECDLKSGTLITAQHALDQNRTVYAVPGPIYADTSKGPNNLIKMGAKLVTEASDILEDLHVQPVKIVTPAMADTTEEQQILTLLAGGQTLHTDMLIQSSGLSAGVVTTTLTFLEMKGKIRNVGGQQYIRSR